MIRIEKLNKYFNRHRKNELHVINNTSLTLEDSGLVALLGPSGSGKTTLLNAIGGLDKVKSGHIYIDGKKITSKWTYQVDRLRNLNIGYIFQDYKLVENLSVYENVALVLKMIGIKNKKEIDKRVTYVLEKVGMYRYRKRPANMLSGGERQRVGIARAIVKNPNIIIADEPTGNLDSKNSIEIMNIIKAISKDRLVILVTHEVNLAKFYASRIIEISDGKIVNDYLNDHDNELDYAVDNRFYLKDFEHHSRIEEDAFSFDIYSDKKEKINLDIIVKNNNLYIRNNTSQKIEVIDNESNIEIVNDHFKKMDRKTLEKYQFDFENIIDKNQRLKYSSIFNPLTFVTNGFKKVFGYSLIKKLLLIGFFLSGCFIMLSASRIAANLKVEDKDFIRINRNYLTIETNKVKEIDYLNYEKEEGIYYAIPTNSLIDFNVKLDEYYQMVNYNRTLSGSLASMEMIDKEDIIMGRMPENSDEIVVDKLAITNMYSDNLSKMLGFTKIEEMLGKELVVPALASLKIVGITDLESPSIYVAKEKMLPILYNNKTSGEMHSDQEMNTNKYQDYLAYQNKVSLKEGRWPENDYEVVVNISEKEEKKLNKEIKDEINNHRLKVVGYYDAEDKIDNYFVNHHMIFYELLKNSKNITIYPEDKEKALLSFRDKYAININDSYQVDKEKYLSDRSEGTKLAITSSLVILVISFVEIVLMLRASFLSRIKEVGIYRAIGVKKKDIYIMFSGEIIAITTLASLPGILLSAYIINILTGISALQKEFVIHLPLVFITIVCIYIFNLIMGLIPVFSTIRKRPAQILSRTDI